VAVFGASQTRKSTPKQHRRPSFVYSLYSLSNKYPAAV
jgi:hypothetical protein